MGWKTIWERGEGRRAYAEQDEATGNITVHANIVELSPDEATELATKMSTAAFPFVKTSRG